ncbi:alpha/beta hydrolase [Paracoccus sediminilitoris]|uniref:alpha/beta hydrolase n=1 Tax=Paracoccus sediminilitoris TaxID=2202419 RepID=UPI000DB9F6B1|nr:alpha/beta hydrolase [Paracoccus sediminilitoris]
MAHSTRATLWTTAAATSLIVALTAPAFAQDAAADDVAGQTEMQTDQQSGTNETTPQKTTSADSDAGETTSDETAPMSGTMDRADADMARVLEALKALDPKPIPELAAEEARQQPTPADAVARVIEEDGLDVPEPAVTRQDITYPAAEGDQPARVYTPTDAGEGPYPLVVYVHGGGWAIADIDTYDASAASLADKLGAVVISLEYRHAPESPFPAAHDDVLAGYTWAVENGDQLNADVDRLALVGESVGGNMVVATAIAARDQQLTQPDHVVSVYPVAQTSLETESYVENAEAVPLNRAMMEWFFDQTVTDESQLDDARISLVDADLAGLPPITIINASIDPLLSDGMMLADAIEAAGGEVEQRTFDGVTHEFFGMAAVVEDAAAAQDYAVERVNADLGK